MFTSSPAHRIDFAKAIKRQQAALVAVVAAIFRMLKIEDGGAQARIEPWLHRKVLRLLRPAESACRRLIVVAARGLVMTPAPVRAARPGSPGASPRMAAAPGDGAPRRPRPPAFRLSDPRKTFRDFMPQRSHPRPAAPAQRRARFSIRVLGDNPHLVPPWATPGYQPPPPPPPVPPPPIADGLVNGRLLARRLEALRLALADLPKQAQRLLRWQAKRQAQDPPPPFRDPLRPGRPPGYRKAPVHEVDTILDECDFLAYRATRNDTS